MSISDLFYRIICVDSVWAPREAPYVTLVLSSGVALTKWGNYFGVERHTSNRGVRVSDDRYRFILMCQLQRIVCTTEYRTKQGTNYGGSADYSEEFSIHLFAVGVKTEAEWAALDSGHIYKSKHEKYAEMVKRIRDWLEKHKT